MCHKVVLLAFCLIVTLNTDTEAATSSITASPSSKVTQQTASPTAKVTQQTASPTAKVTQQTASPTAKVTQQTASPTAKLTQQTASPTAKVTQQTASPTAKVTQQTASPTAKAAQQTASPTAKVTQQTVSPTVKVTQQTASPTAKVTQQTASTTAKVTQQTASPTAKVTQQTASPTAKVTQQTASPTAKAAQQTASPTAKVTQQTASPPTKFSYSCDVGGDLTVNKTQLSSYKMKLLGTSVTNCNLTENGTEYKIKGCGKNKEIYVVLEKNHTARITGGKSSREFQLYCDDSTKPYVVNVTLSAVNVNESNKYTTLPSVTPPKAEISLTMKIFESTGQTPIAQAVIGQEMLLKITYTGNDMVDPVKCYAENGNERYMFWSEQSCETDSSLVGHKWENKTDFTNNFVSIALYAFHFEKSHDVRIMCSVRVCPVGYTGNECDLSCNTSTGNSGKRKRRTAFANEIKTVRANIHVIDTEPVTDSSKGLAVNIFYVLISAMVVNLHLW